jgi:hypothetical protein
MQPVESYLNNLAKLLPAGQRDDILRELSEDIHSEIEDKESSLGRPLNEDEQRELLKRRGTPLQIAAGYTHNKGTLAFGPQLIGPVLFPFYARVLLFNIGLTLLVLGSVFAVFTLSGQPIHTKEFLFNVMLQIFIQLAAVTVIFTLVERHLDSHSYSRKPVKVQADLAPRIREEAAKPRKQEVSRFDSIAVLVASSVALLWIQSLWAKPFFVFGPAASLITFAPVWQTVYLPTVFLMLLAIVRACINIAQPNWVRFRDCVAVFLNVGGLAILYVLLSAHTWVVPVSSADANSGAQYLASVINRWMPFGLWVAAAISIGQTIHDLVRLYKNWRWGSTAQQA